MSLREPRIPLPGREELDAAQTVVFDAVVSGKRGTLVGPLRAAIHNPELADRWQKLGEQLRYDTVLPPMLSELSILLTARRWNAEIEWTIHAGAARKAGLAEEFITAIREGRAPDFQDQALQEVYDYTCSLQSTGQVTDAQHAAIRERWGVVGVVELTAIIGYYTMVSFTLNAHRIPLPDSFKAELYPNGEAPPYRLTGYPAGDWLAG